MERALRSLVVEDDLTTRTVLTELLGQYGECQAVTGGGAAIESFLTAIHEGSPYDLVCLDIRMPGVNGIHTLAILRKHEAAAAQAMAVENPDDHRTCMVMTTSVTSQDAVDKATKKLCDAYLVKPVTQQLLEKTLDKFGLI